VAGLSDKAKSSVLQGGAGEEAAGEGAGCCRPTGYRSPWAGRPGPGPAGDEPGSSGGEELWEEGPGAAPLGRSGEEQGEAG